MYRPDRLHKGPDFMTCFTKSADPLFLLFGERPVSMPSRSRSACYTPASPASFIQQTAFVFRRLTAYICNTNGLRFEVSSNLLSSRRATASRHGSSATQPGSCPGSSTTPEVWGTVCRFLLAWHWQPNWTSAAPGCSAFSVTVS